MGGRGGKEWGAYHGLLPVAVPHPLVALSLILGLHPGLALVLSLIILLVGLLRPELCLLPGRKRRKGIWRLLAIIVEASRGNSPNHLLAV